MKIRVREMRKHTCLLGLEPRLPLRLQVTITSQQYRLSTHVPQGIEVACRPDIWRPRCTRHAPKLPHIRRAQPSTSTCMPTRTSLGAHNAECSMLSAQRGYAPDASAKGGPSSTPAAHEGAVLPVTGLEHELEQRQLIPVHLCRGQRRGVTHLSAVTAASSLRQYFSTCSRRASSPLRTCTWCWSFSETVQDYLSSLHSKRAPVLEPGSQTISQARMSLCAVMEP